MHARVGACYQEAAHIHPIILTRTKKAGQKPGPVGYNKIALHQR